MKIALGILTVSLGVMAGCGGQSAPNAAGAPPEVEVYVVPARTTTDAKAYVAPSTLTVEHEADILAEENGLLVQVMADLGKRVKRNEILARLDDSQLRKEWEQDRAEMQMLEVQSRETQVLRQAAEVELQRQSELFKEGLGSQRDYDRARFNLEAMKLEVEKARLSHERAKAKVEADEMRLSRMQLRASFDGIVSRRYARVGQTLLRDEKVLRVTELRPLVVRFTVPEALRQDAGIGAQVEVRPAEDGAAVKARVVRNSYVVDAASGSLECTAQLLEPVPTSLVPGLTVDVKLLGATRGAGSSVMIPATAVLRQPGGAAAVLAVSGGRLQKRNVKLGQESTASVQVLSGLAPGDSIVLRASEKLQDGATVRVRQ